MPQESQISSKYGEGRATDSQHTAIIGNVLAKVADLWLVLDHIKAASELTSELHFGLFFRGSVWHD